MKKIALFLSLIFAFTLAACAQQTPVVQPNETPDMTEETTQTVDEAVTVEMIAGTVIEITEEGILIDTAEQGEILVLTGSETVFETTGEIAAGDYIYVDHDGQMTFSIPAQITASLVRMHKMEGDITEVYTEGNAVLLHNEETGDVFVHLPEEWKDTTIDFTHMTVYFDGVMTMSLPGQISAGLVIPGYSVQGAISEIGDGYIIIGEGMESIQIAHSEGMLPETAEIGAVIRTIYDGQMTRSIPAQITASEIIQISR